MKYPSPTPTAQPAKEYLRLLLVVDPLDFGGAEWHIVDLAVALRRKGYEAKVACLLGGELSDALQESGIPARPLLVRLVTRRFSLAFTRILLKGGRFDLVQPQVYASVPAAAVATLGLAVPLVITEHSGDSWRTWRARQISRWVYRRASEAWSGGEAHS